MQYWICLTTLCCVALLATTLAAPASIMLASLIDKDVDSGDASTSDDVLDNFVQHFRLTRPDRQFDEDFHIVPHYHVGSSLFRPMSVDHVVRRPTLVQQASRPSSVTFAESSKTIEVAAARTRPEVETTHDTETAAGAAVASDISGDVNTSMTSETSEVAGVTDSSLTSESTEVSGVSETSEVAGVTDSSLAVKGTGVSGDSVPSETTKTARVSDVSETVETSETSETLGDSDTSVVSENVEAAVASEVTEGVEAGHGENVSDVSVASGVSEVSQDAEQAEKLPRKELDAEGVKDIAGDRDSEKKETETPEFAMLTSDKGKFLISGPQVVEKSEEGSEISSNETEVSSSLHSTEHRNVISVDEPNIEVVESQSTEGLQDEVEIVIDDEAELTLPLETSASEAGVDMETIEGQEGEEEEDLPVEIMEEEGEKPEEIEREGLDLECKCASSGKSGVKFGQHPVVHPPIWKPVKRTSHQFIQSLVHKPITEPFDRYDRYSQLLGYDPYGIF